MPTVVRNHPLTDFPVLDFVADADNLSGKFMAADGVKLIRSAINIVMLHVSAADSRRFDFNHDVIRAANRLRYINHLIAAKGLTKSCQCFHCVFLC
ncbi:hypothetical protein MTE2_4657 [Klebsiella pneumoniae VA360]|nr:hypothetical protein MTE2_4657 [Klebsiella pneumoniae VA360]